MGQGNGNTGAQAAASAPTTSQTQWIATRAAALGMTPAAYTSYLSNTAAQDGMSLSNFVSAVQGQPTPASINPADQTTYSVAQLQALAANQPNTIPDGDDSAGETSQQMASYIASLGPETAITGPGTNQGSGKRDDNNGGVEVTPAAAQAISNVGSYGNVLGTPVTSTFDDLMSKLIPAFTVGAATAGVAGPAVAAGADALGTAGAIGAGAGVGAAGGALQAGLTGNKVGTGALTGALSGGIGVAAQPAVGALSDATGLGSTASNALVKGAIGAGTGALGGALTGTGAARGAEVGGISGAANGAVTGATNSSLLGQVAGTGAGILANKYIAPSATTPAASTAASTATNPLSLPTPSNGTGTTNIGQYSGYGYAPRTQTNPNIDYSTYGQGPEAQFFTGEQAAPSAPAAPQSSTQPVRTTINP